MKNMIWSASCGSNSIPDILFFFVLPVVVYVQQKGTSGQQEWATFPLKTRGLEIIMSLLRPRFFSFPVSFPWIAVWSPLDEHAKNKT